MVVSSYAQSGDWAFAPADGWSIVKSPAFLPLRVIVHCTCPVVLRARGGRFRTICLFCVAAPALTVRLWCPEMFFANCKSTTKVVVGVFAPQYQFTSQIDVATHQYPRTLWSCPMSHVNLSQCLIPGDEVAILPYPHCEPAEVLEIGTVFYVGPVFIQLVDGRRFDTIIRRGLNTPGWIVLATEDHRDVLQTTVQ